MGIFNYQQRICDLDLEVKNHWILEVIEEVRDTLSKEGLCIPVEINISDDWYCLDGQISISIPFYILNSSLFNFFKKEIGFVEGGTRTEAKKILLHELGHAFENAYNLKRHKKRKALFGDSNEVYPSSYTPRYNPTDFVEFLGEQYGQAHPDEDFAETFAFCLSGKKLSKSHSEKAFEKVEYMHSLFSLYRDHLPKNIKHKKVDLYQNDRRTLSEFIYERRTQRRNFSRGLIKGLLSESFAKSNLRRHNKSHNIFKELSFEIEKFFPNKYEASALTNRLSEVVKTERLELVLDQKDSIKLMKTFIKRNKTKLKNYGWCRVPL